MAHHFIDLLSPLSQVSTRIFHCFMQASPTPARLRVPAPGFIPSPINRTSLRAIREDLAAVSGLPSISLPIPLAARVSIPLCGIIRFRMPLRPTAFQQFGSAENVPPPVRGSKSRGWSCGYRPGRSPCDHTDSRESTARPICDIGQNSAAM